MKIEVGKRYLTALGIPVDIKSEAADVSGGVFLGVSHFGDANIYKKDGKFLPMMADGGDHPMDLLDGPIEVLGSATAGDDVGDVMTDIEHQSASLYRDIVMQMLATQNSPMQVVSYLPSIYKLVAGMAQAIAPIVETSDKKRPIDPNDGFDNESRN